MVGGPVEVVPPVGLAAQAGLGRLPVGVEEQLLEPALMLSVGRRLASEGLTPGTTRQWTVFDPATMQNAPVTIEIDVK